MEPKIKDLAPALPRADLGQVVAVLLAGGQGSRLHELTARTCKPALPLFSTRKGPLRMVDFTMANAVRSGLSRLIAATQYCPETLEAHLTSRWAPLFPEGGLIIRNGTELRGREGYGGTADAVAANSALIDECGAGEVLILSGDHVYQMDYSAMIAAHRAAAAKVTMAVHHVPLSDASDFGVVERTSGGTVTGFAEKPARPVASPGFPGQASVSIGVYVLDWAWLRAHLPAGRSCLDFGKDIVPLAVAAGVAAAYELPAMAGQAAPYWRDVGTLDSLRRTLLDFAGEPPCHVPVLPGAPFRLSGMTDAGRADPGGEAWLDDSVVLPGARVMPGARLHRAIVAPGTVVQADVEVGAEPVSDGRWFRRSDGGTTLVTNAMLSRRTGQALVQLRGALQRAFELPPVAC